MSRLGLLAGSFCLLFSATVDAQLTLHYYPSSPPKDGSIPQSCLDAGTALQRERVRFPRPSTWTVYIACDDEAWFDVMAKLHPGASAGWVYGDSDPVKAITFFRGTTLTGVGHQQYTAEHLVAHELAHIYLHSFDEEKVDRLAVGWIRSKRGELNVIAEAR